MGLRLDHQAGCSYGRRGQTPGTGKRFRCNTISVLTNRGPAGLHCLSAVFQGDCIQQFLSRLIRHARRRLFLVVDQHPVHYAAALKPWLKTRRDQIRLGYSPELNPDEFLNLGVQGEAT